MGHRETELINFFKRKRGLVSYAEIKEAGFNKALLKVSIKSGRIQKVDRALYELSEGIPLSNPDLVAISIKAPKGVVCLLSALSFYRATTEIPQFVSIAIPRGAHANKIKYPPVKFYRFASKAWNAGIEEHKVEGHKIKVYNLAKTIADCFKFRNKIGMDVTREALKAAIMEKKIAPKEIMKYAKICRVDRFIKPMLEALL